MVAIHTPMKTRPGTGIARTPIGDVKRPFAEVRGVAFRRVASCGGNFGTSSRACSAAEISVDPYRCYGCLCLRRRHADAASSASDNAQPVHCIRARPFPGHDRIDEVEYLEFRGSPLISRYMNVP